MIWFTESLSFFFFQVALAPPLRPKCFGFGWVSLDEQQHALVLNKHGSWISIRAFQVR